MEKEKLEEIIRQVISNMQKKSLIVAGNWKMNMTVREGMAFLQELGEIGEDDKVILFPPYTTMAVLAEEFAKRRIVFGPQNFHEQDSGAFTGEISLPMIRELGCSCLLAGHSERRSYYGETDTSINAKVRKALREGFQVMICIGEQLVERQSGRWREVLENQLTRDLQGIPRAQLSKLYIAYEPIWAIGTGITASVDEIADTHACLKRRMNAYLGQELPILYGGSVNEKNAQQIGKIVEVDGFLIGGASLKADSFKKIIEVCRQ